MFQNTPSTLPTIIECLPIVSFRRTATRKQPEPHELGQLAARDPVGLTMSCQGRDDIKSSKQQLAMRGGQLRHKGLRECQRRVRSRSLCLSKRVIPRPVRRVLAERVSFEFQMAKAPAQDGGDVVGRARVVELGFKCGDRSRGSRSERGYRAFGSQREYVERDKFALHLRRRGVPVRVHDSQGFQT